MSHTPSPAARPKYASGRPRPPCFSPAAWGVEQCSNGSRRATISHTNTHTHTHTHTHTSKGESCQTSSPAARQVWNIWESRNAVKMAFIAQHTATHCNTLQHTATHCNTLQHTATHCNTLQHTATHYNTLQHTATHCNTLQHTATHRQIGVSSSAVEMAIIMQQFQIFEVADPRWVADTEILKSQRASQFITANGLHTRHLRIS